MFRGRERRLAVVPILAKRNVHPRFKSEPRHFFGRGPVCPENHPIETVRVPSGRKLIATNSSIDALLELRELWPESLEIRFALDNKLADIRLLPDHRRLIGQTKFGPCALQGVLQKRVRRIRRGDSVPD